MTRDIAPKGRALVLGATGHLGNALLREAAIRGYEVTGTCRSASGRANLDGVAADVVAVDHADPSALGDLAARHDLVIDAAAPYPVSLTLPGKARAEVAAARARSAVLTGAVARSGGRLAYVSSFTTLPRRGSGLGRIGSSLVQRSHPYFETKRAIEADLLAAARRGLPVTVVNPSACLGPWDMKRREHCLIPAALNGELAASMRREVNVVDVRDVARATLDAVEAGETGRPVPLIGHDIAADALIALACRLGGARPPLLRAPAGLAAAGAWWVDAMLAAGGIESPYPSLPFLLISESRAMRGEYPEALSATEPLMPLERTLADSIAWYRAIGYC